jgi:hypothetical protein
MKQKIRINVYDIIDFRLLKRIGLGLHHSGVQIGDQSEYEYGDGYGITIVEPKTAIGATFSHSIELGTIKTDVVSLLLREMYTEFTGDNYDILSRNCNHFTEQFVYKLTRVRVPKYINRVASLFAYDKNRKANILFIEYLNKANIKWFPITNTMRDLAEKGILNDEILQIGLLNQHSDRLKRIYHKKYVFEDTIYGFRVYTKERPLVANIWLFDVNPKNKLMTVYSGPKNTFLLHRLLKNEWIRTQYLDHNFVYNYDKTHINMFTNAADYIQIINGNSKYNMFIRFLLTGQLCFREFTRDSDSTLP